MSRSLFYIAMNLTDFSIFPIFMCLPVESTHLKEVIDALDQCNLA